MYLLVLIVVPTLVFSAVVLAGRHFLLAEDPFDDDDDDGYDPYDDDDYPDDDEYYATLKNQYANSDWLLEQLAELERWKRETLASKAELSPASGCGCHRRLFRPEG